MLDSARRVVESGRLNDSAGKQCGYLVWGVADKIHKVVGTDFSCRNAEGEPLEHWLARQLSPSCAFAFSEGLIDGKRVVALSAPAAKTVPTSFANERWFRIGSNKENLCRYPEREAQPFSVLRDGLPSVSNMPAERQDLEFERLFTYCAGKGVQLRIDAFKTNLGLCWPEGRSALNAAQRAVLEAVANDPLVMQIELEGLVGKSRNTIQRSLSFLRDNGYTERVGSKKSGYWNVLKH